MARDRNGLPVVIAAAVPLLAMQFGVEFLRYQVRRKRGVRGFRRALLRSGMSKDQAARLTQAYHEAGSIRTILRGGLRMRTGARGRSEA